MRRKEADLFSALGALFALVTIAVAPATMLARGALLRCHKCGQQCETHMLVEKTIMVPMKVIETRMQSCLVEKMEERDEKYTAFKMVKDKKDIKKECCYLEDEVKSKVITEKHCRLVDVPLTRICKTEVPEIECVEKVHCKEVCTECGPVLVEEVCMEEQARMREDVCVEQECKKQLVFEEVQREIFYCVKTPKKKSEVVCTEESFKLEPVQKTRKVQVCVPKFEKRPVEVEVVKMVPKTIVCCVKCQ